MGGYLGGMSSFSATLGLCVYLAWGWPPVRYRWPALPSSCCPAGRSRGHCLHRDLVRMSVSGDKRVLLSRALPGEPEGNQPREGDSRHLSTGPRQRHDAVRGDRVVASTKPIEPENGQQTWALARAERAGPGRAWKLAIVTALLNITNVPHWAGVGLLIERSRLSVADKVSIIFVTSVVASVTFIFVTILVLASRGRLDRLLGRAATSCSHSGSVVPGFLAGVRRGRVGRRQ